MRKLLIFIILFPVLAYGAVDPIARTDVVPLQTINSNNSPFNFGVVAFAIDGITNVSFAISGGTYTGSSPKTSSSMALNTRLAYETSGELPGWTGWPGVWEYYIQIPISDFSADGSFTVTPTVTNASGSRVLSAVTMFADVSPLQSAPTNFDECWVDADSGNDGTGAPNDNTHPYQHIEAAVAACQTANGGSSDGNIIYLEEGDHDTVGTGTVTTTNKWLTITAASGASRDNVIISDGGGVWETKYLHFDGITMRSDGKADFVIRNSYYLTSDGPGPQNLWTSNCKFTNSLGRWGGTYPNQAGNGDYQPILANKITSYYSTNDYTTDVDRAYGSPTLVRNATIYKISEDCFQNGEFAVNIRLDDQDPSDEILAAYPHADTTQLYGGASDANQIFYNLFATNLHYQGAFIDATSASSGALSNKAFVNMFMEMREPGRKSSSGGGVVLTAGATAYIAQRDHYLWWHCTFPYKIVRHSIITGDGSISNSSFIGDIFWELPSGSSWPADTEMTPLEYGNGSGNEALYNHYKCSETITGSNQCYDTYAKAPDSSDGRTTFTEGDATHPEVIDMSDSTTYGSNFGEPLESSGLIDRLPSNLTGIPADILGNARDSTPDVGAFEVQASPPTSTGYTGGVITGGVMQ